MPKPIPFPTRKKETPESTPVIEETPEQKALRETVPEPKPEKIEQPTETSIKEETPNESPEKEETPVESAEKEVPSGLNEANCIEFDGKKIEIKPTKLKYFRNKAASGYGIIKAVPLHELMTYDKGVLDKERDADHLLFDFLVAAFDDSTFVRDNYENFTAETVEQVIKIFGRINHIDEKEEQARKNREAQAKR